MADGEQQAIGGLQQAAEDQQGGADRAEQPSPDQGDRREGDEPDNGPGQGQVALGQGMADEGGIQVAGAGIPAAALELAFVRTVVHDVV